MYDLWNGAAGSIAELGGAVGLEWEQMSLPLFIVSMPFVGSSYAVAAMGS